MVTSRVVWATVAGLALVASVAWALKRGGEPPSGEPSSLAEASAPSAEVARLRTELAELRTRNQELSGEVEWLRAQLALLGETPAPLDEPPEGETPGAETPSSDSEEGKKGWFDGDALVAGGVSPYDVERLREAFDASEMDLIELENEARREGWFRTQRYWEALRDLRVGLREDIGDEAYDQLLFATGRNNRVVIDEVLRDSPGARAGLQPGDVLISYDGRRIFKAGELKKATTQGQLGDRVAIDLLRDGERRRIYLERGPIGTKLDRARMLPEWQ
ncbi:MAG: PDZ domain-containing protein [Myxococcota bacterium]|nr:PDZ domain-containing protein [Myxococcota bacterium]